MRLRYLLEISQREAEINSEASELRVGFYELAAKHKLFETRHCHVCDVCLSESC